jgi:hypothetical protein
MSFKVSVNTSEKTEEVLPVLVDPQTKVELKSTPKCSSPECYKHHHEGDLHKMYNTKSDYLMDMLFKE